MDDGVLMGLTSRCNRVSSTVQMSFVNSAPRVVCVSHLTCKDVAAARRCSQRNRDFFPADRRVERLYLDLAGLMTRTCLRSGASGRTVSPASAAASDAGVQKSGATLSTTCGPKMANEKSLGPMVCRGWY